jgi:hypothetical protein
MVTSLVCPRCGAPLNKKISICEYCQTPFSISKEALISAAEEDAEKDPSTLFPNDHVLRMGNTIVHGLYTIGTVSTGTNSTGL